LAEYQKNGTIQPYIKKKNGYFALFAFLAQASLQYFFLASKVINFCLQIGHFLSKHYTSPFTN
jgi:hypothetical protein